MIGCVAVLMLSACGAGQRDDPPATTESVTIDWCVASVPDATAAQRTCDAVTLTYIVPD